MTFLINFCGATIEMLERYRSYDVTPTTLGKATLQVVYQGGEVGSAQDVLPVVYHIEAEPFDKDLVRRAHTVITPSHWAADYVSTFRDTPPVIIPPGTETGGECAPDGGYFLWDGLVDEYLPIYQTVAESGASLIYRGSTTVNRWNVTKVDDGRFSDLLLGASAYIASTKDLYPHGITQAMRFGVPVIAFDRGAVQDLVRHGVNGVLCPFSPDAVLRAMRYCTTHRQILGDNGRAIIARNDWSKVMPALLRVYAHSAQLDRPAQVTMYALHDHNVSVGDWVDSILNNKSNQLVEIVICAPVEVAGKAAGHTLSFIDNQTELHGGCTVNGVRLRTQRYRTYTHMMGVRLALREARTKYIAYNRIGAYPITQDSLVSGVRYLEENPGMAETVSGGLNIQRVAPTRISTDWENQGVYPKPGSDGYGV